MALTMSLRGKKAGWEASFSFPSIGLSRVGAPFAVWESGKWTCLGGARIGLYPADTKCPKDPVAAVVKTGKGFKLCMKSGSAFPAPDDLIAEMCIHESIYWVVSAPSVYEIWLGVAMFKTLACFGYCEKNEGVALFTVTNLESDVYHTQIVSSDLVLGPFDDSSAMNPQFKANPAYSPDFEFIEKPKTEVEKLNSEIGLEASKQTKIDEQVQAGLPVTKDLVMEIDNSLKRESKLRSDLIKLIDPTFQEGVQTIFVEDGKLKKTTRRRSEIERERTIGIKAIEASALSKAEFEGMKKLLKIEENGGFPFPIVAKADSPPDVHPLNMPLENVHEEKNIIKPGESKKKKVVEFIDDDVL